MNFKLFVKRDFQIGKFLRHYHNQNNNRDNLKKLQRAIVPVESPNKSISGYLEYGDVDARQTQWGVQSLTSKGFFGTQKSSDIFNNFKLPQLNGKIKLVPLFQLRRDPKQKFLGLTENFNNFIPKSLLHIPSRLMSTKPGTKPENEQPDTSNPSVGSSSKKRAKRKTTGGRFIGDEVTQKYDTKNTFPVVAYSTCEELDLESLHDGLIVQDLYIPTVLSDDMEDVIHVTAKYKISDEPREIFFFREGTVVFWNVPELECVNALKFIRTYEHESYDIEQVNQELEFLRYAHHEQGPTRLSQGRILLDVDSANKLLEKYTFANALASSVKLGIWESTLDRFVDSIAHITEELKRAENLNLSRKEVLQKTGELFSLRHELNLNSDLLDTPDFYWERERLEGLYQKTCNYLNISRRTKVLNEKLAQCCELLELISSHLTDEHHTRLEWMIIALITIEVGFEILHVIERYT